MFAKLLPLLGLSTLSQATTEIVYLANCAGCPTSEGCEYYRSTMDYYPDVTESLDGQYPSAIAGFDWVVGWEGNVMKRNFPDGDTFTSAITTDAQSLANGAYAGFGENKYRSFSCYKDSQRELYQDGTDYCYSIYYCE
ncbi:uncharacterized protein LY89DRAFT_733547 [Mollisia scopiformis]|uniref:Uncharacterized protein n=1 Tax=Mollisia scopiformis TaxID=149040 RepID=A0A194XC19_MOLSC|nr:uncharacterized protein LY89DRAFT_733547 [Mollisia scopiformis]KUJ17718.1 hypothetical protein LY89DRAFT_733547 [Mollisia scopiformis]